MSIERDGLFEESGGTSDGRNEESRKAEFASRGFSVNKVGSLLTTTFRMVRDVHTVTKCAMWVFVPFSFGDDRKAVQVAEKIVVVQYRWFLRIWTVSN